MSDARLKRLFSAARRAQPEALPEDFPARVMATVRREAGAQPARTVLDELDRLFPRLAWTAVLVMALCLAGDLGHSLVAGPDLADGATQWLEQWL